MDANNKISLNGTFVVVLQNKETIIEKEREYILVL